MGESTLTNYVAAAVLIGVGFIQLSRGLAGDSLFRILSGTISVVGGCVFYWIIAYRPETLE